MEKINLVELLKDCPTGMELDSTVFDNITFDYVNTQQNRVYCKVGKSESVWFTPKGGVNLLPDAKCVIFPKGKTTWEGFQMPFKDGDIVYGREFTAIVKNRKDNLLNCHCFVMFYPSPYLEINGCSCRCDSVRFATEEEKKKLFDAIKANGYKWNDETKDLEKIRGAIFKVGDVIKSKCSQIKYTVTDIRTRDNVYIIHNFDDKFGYHISFKEENNYELVPTKFDISTLKPLQPVLVRDTSRQVWTMDLFSHKIDTIKELRTTFVCVGHYPKQCIPYEDNEHLLGTSTDCDEFYKTWE